MGAGPGAPDPLANEPRPDAYVYDPEAEASRESRHLPIAEHILNSECPHRPLRMNCAEVECNNYLRGIEESGVVDNSAEAWEEDWNDSPQLGGMGEELRQLYGE